MSGKTGDIIFLNFVFILIHVINLKSFRYGEEIVPTPQKCQMLGVKRASFSSAATCGRGEHGAE